MSRVVAQPIEKVAGAGITIGEYAHTLLPKGLGRRVLEDKKLTAEILKQRSSIRKVLTEPSEIAKAQLKRNILIGAGTGLGG